jgi:hypothetical protein
VPVAPSFLRLDDDEDGEDAARVSLSDDDVVLVPTPSSAPTDYLRIGVSSYPPQSFPLLRPRPSRRRSLFAKLLFVTIVLAVAILAAIELSTARNLPWLDPRPIFFKAWNFVAHKIPWGRLPKMPKF